MKPPPPRLRSERWPIPTCEVEFEAYMRRLDSYFAALDMPLVARQLAAIAEACFDLGENRFVPRSREPTSGVYDGDDLLLRVTAWYDERYGDALKSRDWTPPSIILLRGELWRVTYPVILGPALFFARDISVGPAVLYSATDVKLLSPGATERLDSGIRKFDVLDFVDDFSSSARELLGSGELSSILTVICRNRIHVHHAVAGRHHKFMEEALGDLAASVDLVLKRPAQTGASKWASLQATEKALKSFLHHASCSYPHGGKHGHDLSHLATLVAAVRGPALSQTRLDEIQCSAGVRYDLTEVDRRDAVRAHHAALECVALVSCANQQEHPL